LAVCVPDVDGVTVAARVELYLVSNDLHAVELANGYQELTDAGEQERRCRVDLEARASAGLERLPVPQHLLDALASGMPSCAGIALGVDRLLMGLLGVETLAEVCAFPADRA
jgi:lysyl-tRNA synthetase class 2